MKKVILLLVMMTSSVAFSQDYYMAKHSTGWEYDYLLGEYEKVSSEKEFTTLVIHREWFALEKTKNNFLRWEWVYYKDIDGFGECHVTEDDAGMACINSEDNKFYLFANMNDETERWDSILVLSDIHKIPSVDILWDDK